MALVLNGFGNCDLDVIGSGTGTCFPDSFGDLTGIVLFKKGKQFPLDTDLTATTWKNALKALDTFPYIGIYNFEQNTPESETATSNTGVMTEIRVGKPQYNFSFTKGSCLHKSLYNKRGQGRWDVGLIFEGGILLAVNQSATAVKGFDGGMFSVATLQLLSGTDPQQSTATIQLLDALEFNTKHTFVTWDKLGFNIGKIDGVLELDISFPNGIDDGSTFDAKVASACNSDEIIPDLDENTHWDLVGQMDSPATITSVTFNASTGLYTFTLSGSLVDNDQVRLVTKDGAYIVAEDVTGNLYKGSSPVAIVGDVPSL